jgi:hypothetical protein
MLLQGFVTDHLDTDKPTDYHNYITPLAGTGAG